MPASDPGQALSLLGVRPGRVVVALSDVPLGNGNWLVETAGGQRFVLRRYHPQTTLQDLAYEHAVLGHMADVGWMVPAAVGEPVCWQGRWYCLTRYVPGQAVRGEDPGQRARRGRDLHYDRERLAGVIDFGLTHVDSRPYELAIARAYRAPEMVDAYRAELAARGWPLSGLEEAALTPVYHAFRVGMAAAEMEDGLRTGNYDLAMIERQLSRTATAAPLRPGLGHY